MEGWPRARFYLPFLIAIAAWAMPAGGEVKAGAEKLKPGDYSFTIEHGGRTRSYLVHMPPEAAEGRALALILNFHGGGGNAAQQERYSRMNATADQQGFIAVYPNGTGLTRMLTWNGGGCCGYAMRHRVDDVGFVRALLDDLEARASVDHARIYATGISNGGMMAYRLGVEMADRIAAIASVEGALMVPVSRLSRPVSLMVFHSVNDTIVPYRGGFGGLGRFTHRTPYPGVDETIERWRRLSGCPPQVRAGPTLTGEPGSADAGNSATRYAWAPCAQSAEVVLWKLGGSGHVWPGASRSFALLLGRRTQIIDANLEMWRFFQSHPLPSS